MTDAELDQVLEALRAGRSFTMRGMDGEWGYGGYDAGKYLLVRRFPYQHEGDAWVTEAEVRRDLAPFPLATILARLG